jgi:Flp pilus assembly protein TadG
LLNSLANIGVFARRWRRLPRHVDGNMMIEFALALPVLSMMLIGLLDLGRFAIDKSSILQAARAGAQYGVVASNAGVLSAADLQSVNTTAQGSTSLAGVTATNSVFCECTSGVTVACTSTCTGGNLLKHYLTVTTTRGFTSVVGATGLHFGSLGNWTAPTSVSASVTMLLP